MAELTLSEDSRIDTAAALELLEGDTELLREVAALFLDDCANRLSRLRDALREGDSKALELAAHSIKGSVSNFAARRAAAAALAVELIARSGDLGGASQACAALEEEVDRVKRALTAFAHADSV